MQSVGSSSSPFLWRVSPENHARRWGERRSEWTNGCGLHLSKTPDTNEQRPPVVNVSLAH